MYTCMYTQLIIGARPEKAMAWQYTRSPLEDSRLFGPSPWKFLATTYGEKQI